LGRINRRNHQAMNMDNLQLIQSKIHEIRGKG
jgi:hypothetical protein